METTWPPGPTSVKYLSDNRFTCCTLEKRLKRSNAARQVKKHGGWALQTEEANSKMFIKKNPVILWGK